MKLKRLLFVSLLLSPVALGGQGRGVDPADLLKPLADSWPTYSGDYTGKRYSALTQVNRLNVKNLTLAWTMSLTGGSGTGGGRGRGGGAGGGGGGGVIVGGEGTGDFGGGGVTIKGTPLMVDGTLYVSSPDNAWAIDAATGASSGTTSGKRAGGRTSPTAGSAW